jgi:hypothetical protein
MNSKTTLMQTQRNRGLLTKSQGVFNPNPPGPPAPASLLNILSSLSNSRLLHHSELKGTTQKCSRGESKCHETFGKRGPHSNGARAHGAFAIRDQLGLESI